mmetsp:Transcript_8557/g.21956  ORF Transcript_8557/g.21956 Transcript_8557/m.21956 type:complete len:204 (+) Transcript_8557:1070-1681(+)
MVPAVTGLPASLGTRRGSPVSMASSTAEQPRTTSPSTGSRSPGSTRSTSPTLTVALGTSTSSRAVSLPPRSITMRALAGMSEARDLRSPVACARACASMVRPSSTTASSMTGSSRKEDVEDMPGPSAAARPPRNEVLAPRLMSEFMLGEPAASIRKPSISSLRPGPSSASAPMEAVTGVLPMAVMRGPCAYSCIPAACSMWPT